jgi:hypothetical protein
MVGQLDTPAVLLWGRDPLVRVEIGDWVGPRGGIDAAAWFAIQPVAKSLYPLRYPGAYMRHSPPQTEGRFGLGCEFRMSTVQAQRESFARLKALMQYEVPMCWQLRNQMQKAARYFVFIYGNCIMYTRCSMGGLLISFIHCLIYFLRSCSSCFIEGYFFLQNYISSPPLSRHSIFLFWNRLRLFLLALKGISFSFDFWNNLNEA